MLYILAHYYDHHYHHSAMINMYLPKPGFALGVCQEKQILRVYYESAPASLSRSFCFDNAFILRM
jgi:hypothetical protein